MGSFESAKTKNKENNPEKKPWEELRSQEESKFVKSYEEKISLDTKTMENIDRILSREAQEEQLDFAKEWFWEHKDDVEKMGYNPNTEKEGEIVNTVEKMGGFNDEEWKNNDNVERLYILKNSMKTEKGTSLDTKFLILNSLSNRTDRLELDIELKRGDRASRKEKKKELKEILEIQTEIVGKISGRDLVDESLGPERNKILIYAISILSFGIGGKLLYLEQVKRFAPKFLKKEIEKYAQMPEKAEGGIESIYKRVADKLITGFITEGLKRDEKSAEELKTIEKEFSGQEIKVNEFLDPIIHRKEGLGGLKSDWEKDEEKIKKFLKKYNVPLDGFGTDNKEINQVIKEYNSAVKRQKGFLKWFIELASLLFKVK